MPDHYGTLAGASAYHAARGNGAWGSSTDDLQQAALVRASSFVDGLGTRLPEPGKAVLAFPGQKTGGRAQLLQWPRAGATDRNGDAIDPDLVPVEVEYATYEAALRELSAPGSLRPDFVRAGTVKREKLGPLETEFFDNTDVGADAVLPVLAVVDQLLAPLMMRRCLISAVYVI
ncbi:hypothetical protein QN096_11615 [Metapseudomonas otitidis]|uniref:DnaT-like ssDNA-binding protein n=1 Tax=Metapseudomonas otitidis TaxID=319939 RepID=UPI00254169A3|nr:DnaT-like ssDNA-binding protein [Pseudomonas otitidis]WIF69748.1 hypothetical protein QN096_11615 [Pseudomonas otitidis]